jgi:hypothetical protein
LSYGGACNNFERRRVNDCQSMVVLRKHQQRLLWSRLRCGRLRQKQTEGENGSGE